ncbi:uncharacterized protein LOC132953828 [Metopolophium dirhodum]|uniref:uncharacterized protein LOC132953828 n=1 Tax=Metopolophium dirhodum TaxID=44670 RepID=UPI00299034B4|nr:uncharacterized protein LOC132953828 [Metopolophium dirhodum]
MPNSSNAWELIANDYNELWNFLQCVGAIDGKHIVMQAPFNSGTEYFNYKGTFSVVLLAAVDAHYCFIFASVGCQGRISDGGVFNNSILAKKIYDESLNLPSPKALPGQKEKSPYVFVCDDAFPLKEILMKPFPGTHLRGSPQRAFNYRLSRAQRVVENTFGIMASVFRVLRKPLLLQPEKINTIVLACVHLHNFLRRSESSKNVYSPPDIFDSEAFENRTLKKGTWRSDSSETTSFLPLKKCGRKSAAAVHKTRERFAHYFATAGRVYLQDEFE